MRKYFFFFLKFSLVFLFLVLISLNCFANSNTNEKEGFSFSKLQDGEPVPYRADEFPRGLQDLRRFEQIFIGSFPLSIFFAQLLGFTGMSIHQIIINSYSEESSSDSSVVEFSSENWKIEDKIRVISAGVGISFGIAVIDAILYHTRRKEEETKYKRKRLLTRAEEKNVDENSEDRSFSNNEEERVSGTE